MGTRTDPGYELFDNNCLACFDPGETPKKMFVTFTGIKFIDPNVLKNIGAVQIHWVLEQSGVTPCRWNASKPPAWNVSYIANDVFGSGLFCTYQVFNVFNSIHPAPCDTGFENQNIPGPPDMICFDGRGQVFWRPETNSPSIKGIMKKINMEPHRNTMFEGFPLDDTHAVAKYCRTRDATNIKIKFEI